MRRGEDQMTAGDAPEESAAFQLLRAFARHSATEADAALARDLVAGTSVNWDAFLSLCVKQKVAGLVHLNLHRWGLEARVTPAARMAFRLLYHAHRRRNRSLLATMREVVTHLAAAAVDARPLKGSILVPLVYSDGGSRILSDIDLFIRKADASRVATLMQEIGFVQGAYCAATRSIEPLRREEQMIWKLKMYNLPGFLRLSDDDFVDVDCVDFAFGLSFSDDRDLSGEMLSRRGVMAGIETFHPVDFFIHVCCHLYKEASNDAWVQLGLDVNLIKFCDVRELGLKLFAPSADGARNRHLLGDRVALLGVHNSVYFAVFFAHRIYGDAVLADILACLGEVPDGQDGFFNDIYLQGRRKIRERGRGVLDSIVFV